MVMIVHQTVGVTAPSKPINHFGQAFQKGLAVGNRLDNRLEGIASAGDVIKGMRKLEAKRTGHGRSLAFPAIVLQDLTPYTERVIDPLLLL